LDTGRRVYSELDEEKKMAQALSQAIKLVGAVGVLATHLRKNENKRATLEDIKGNSHLAYSAKVVIGVFNDAKVKRNKSQVMWDEIRRDGSVVAMPILEAHFLKAKTSDYNGVICFKQWPALGRVIEPDDPAEQKSLQDLVFGGV